MLHRHRTRLLLAATTVALLTACGGETASDEPDQPGAVEPDEPTSGEPDQPDAPFVGAEEMGVGFMTGPGCFPDAFPEVPGDTINVVPGGTGDGTPDAPASLPVGLCSARGGQTVVLAPGTYRSSIVVGAFEHEEPVIVRGEDGVVLDGEGTRPMGIGVVESRGFTIEGIEFRNYLDTGLYVLLGSDIEIRDNRFVDNGRASSDPDSDGEGFGVSVVGTTDVVIDGNEAVGNGPNDERMADATLGTGIDTFELVDAVISNNVSRDNRGGGILVEEGTNVVVEGNTITGNTLDAAGDWWDGGIWVDGGRDVVVRSNTVTGNDGPGIQLSDEEGAYPGGSVGFVLEGNTVTGNLYGVYVWGWQSCPDPPPDAVTFSDNTLDGNEREDVWCRP